MNKISEFEGNYFCFDACGGVMLTAFITAQHGMYSHRSLHAQEELEAGVIIKTILGPSLPWLKSFWHLPRSFFNNGLSQDWTYFL